MKSLVIDDDAVSNQILSKALAPYGECNSALSGEQGYQSYISALQAGVPYDLLTLDMEMPGMSGLDVLKKIREYESSQGISLGQGVKIIFVSAHDQAKDVLPAFRSGCEAYLVKPHQPVNLDNELKKLGLIET